MDTNDPARRIIGGMFGLEVPTGCTSAADAVATQGVLALVNARSCLWWVIRQVAPTCVWLPSYLCAAVTEAVARAGAPHRFYAVDRDLRTAPDAALRDVKPGEMVVAIDYFGFPTASLVLQFAKARGAWTFRDAAQVLFPETETTEADFTAYSPRKFLGLPDGGLLRITGQLDASARELTPPPSDWWLAAFRAAQCRRDADLHGGDNSSWFPIFKEVEDRQPTGAYRMSELSAALLARGWSPAAVRERRVANYRCLAGLLAKMALFPELPTGVIPLGFPVRVRGRDRIRERLFAWKIFPPVHWPLEGVVPAEYAANHQLAREIMTLPCDQRYEPADMERMTGLLLEAVGG